MFGTEEVHDAPSEGDGLFFHNSRVRFKQVSDGLSKTLLLGSGRAKLGGTGWVGVVA